jgi:uncharacterized membrane protein
MSYFYNAPLVTSLIKIENELTEGIIITSNASSESTYQLVLPVHTNAHVGDVIIIRTITNGIIELEYSNTVVTSNNSGGGGGGGSYNFDGGAPNTTYGDNGYPGFDFGGV